MPTERISPVSIFSNLLKLVLYQETKEPPFEFTAGLEDHRPHTETGSEGRGSESGTPGEAQHEKPQQDGETGDGQPRTGQLPLSRRAKKSWPKPPAANGRTRAGRKASPLNRNTPGKNSTGS